jgi:uncharacterized membrane protein
MARVVDWRRLVRREERKGLRRLGGRSEQTGMFLAAVAAPGTFQRTLMPRGTVDQGIATGIVMALDHAIGALVQDLVDVAALEVTGAKPHREQDDRRWRRAALALDAVAVAVGLGARAAFRDRPGQRFGRAAARTAGTWLARGGAAGLSIGLAQTALHRVDDAIPGRQDYRSLPVALPAGAVAAASLEWVRRRRDAGQGAAEPAAASAAKAVAVGGGVSLVLAGLAHLERAFAGVIGRAAAALAPGHPRVWRPLGHLVALGAMGAGLVETMRRVDRTIETKASRVEPAFEDPPASPLVSGSSESAVPWATLSRQGRRNVSTALTPEEIEAVMGEAAAADPIRVFVGLDSARSERERAELAMKELERTGAFDRDLLMVISPTGTGYVNYVTVEAAEYMTRGNCASVTLQYSKRPSVLSLDRVALQKRQYRMLVESIHAALDGRDPRPRVVLFGESLGAWTSEDSFQGEGTKGLQDLGVDRALWIGTPHETRWKDQVAAGGPNVDPEVVAAFNDFGQLEAQDAERRRALRYVMITHDNDAVNKFGLSLLVRQPSWLGAQDSRPKTVPPTERWSSPTTFVLTLIDMKNAANVIAGQFEAKGHDYRADLARFVREVYALSCTDDQLAAVEAALRRDELARKERIDERDKKRKR